MPRDIPTAISFCNFYKIDLQEWATGEASLATMNRQDVLEAVVRVREFEREFPRKLRNDEFTGVLEIILADGAAADILRALTDRVYAVEDKNQLGQP